MDYIAANLPNAAELVTILLMGSVTYFTRIIGFLVLSRANLSKRTQAVLEASPGCIMISIAAPYFATSDWKMLVSLFAAIVVSLRFNFAITVIAAVAVNALLQQLV